jgi:hypothetical protein
MATKISKLSRLKKANRTSSAMQNDLQDENLIKKLGVLGEL